MKNTTKGNRERMSDIVAKVNSERRSMIFPTNDITYVRIKNDTLEFCGMFCKAFWESNKQENTQSIELKVRLRRQFVFIGVFLLVFFSGFLLGENVTINGNSNPSIWERIGFVLVGLTLFSIPCSILLSLKSEFEKKVKHLINSQN
ncbi:MAG: hypothetical protein ACJAUV_001282 [Flavobacteriales bacterium]|jgi:hypothetical protein